LYSRKYVLQDTSLETSAKYANQRKSTKQKAHFRNAQTKEMEKAHLHNYLDQSTDVEEVLAQPRAHQSKAVVSGAS
jgi:hypothetical protein